MVEATTAVSLFFLIILFAALTTRSSQSLSMLGYYLWINLPFVPYRGTTSQVRKIINDYQDYTGQRFDFEIYQPWYGNHVGVKWCVNKEGEFFLFVFSTFFLKKNLNNTHQLAYVVYHEIGHVALKHLKKPEFDNPEHLRVINHLREYLADRFAVYLMIINDYDPLEAINWLYDFSSAEDSLTHPGAEKRINNIKRAIRDYTG